METTKKMKKMIVKTVFTAAALFAAVTVTEAQESGTLTLDLDQALELALSDNPTIKAADMEIQRYDYVRREVRGSHLPSLSAGGQYTFSIVKQEMSKGLSLGADMSAAFTGDLSIPLVVPAVYASLKMTRTQQELAVEQARASRIDLVNAVKKSFYQILLLEKSYDVLRESEATVGETVANTRAMYDAGLASEYDYLTAEVQLSNLQPSILATRNGIVVSKQLLKMYLSIPEEVGIEVAGSLGEYRDEAYELPDMDADIENNSDMRQLEYQQTLLRQQIKLTNTSRMPVLAAYGSVIASGQDKTVDFASMMMGGSGVVNKWWWQTPVSAGFQLSVPIFSGFKNTNKVKQLRNQVSQVELQKQYLREAKQLEARTSVNNLMTARETMLANEKTVAQADKAHTISRARFDAGAGTMLEVNMAELNVTQARLNHSQSIYDYLAAKADYDKVVGKGE